MRQMLVEMQPRQTFRVMRVPLWRELLRPIEKRDEQMNFPRKTLACVAER